MTVRFLLSLMAPYRTGLQWLTLLLLIQSAILLSMPWLAGQLGAAFLSDESGHWIQERPVLLTVAMLALLAGSAAFRVASNWIQVRIFETVLADLKRRLFAQLQALPLLWHQDMPRGSLLALASYEIGLLGEFITTTLTGFFPRLLTAGGASILMFLIDPALAILVPILVPAFYLFHKIMGRRLRGLAVRVRQQHAEVVTTTEEMLELLPVIKSFTAEPFEQRRYDDRIDELRRLSMRQQQVYAVLEPVSQFTVAAAALLLILLAGQSLTSGDLGPAETVSFLFYVALLVRPVSQLSSIYGEIQTARGTLARLQSVLSETPEDTDPTDRPTPTGAIRFEAVSFAYPGRTATVRELDFEIAEGEIVALVGENGAGKSTAISLLLGFFRPAAGRITLGGRDISEMKLAELRSAIGYVPQNRHLRNASVRENIALGAPDATPAQIEAAARFAQAHDFVTALPDGYDTLIGDKGVKLSGGQQQRLALARALLKDPPILILDEATSMYDLEGEAAFVAECRGALAGRTVILITHRPASLALADHVIRLKDGQIVDDNRPGAAR
ncbi:ABC transporter ATP-binding protein [Tropicimonas sp. TH_r6]|uniref:ABC transporter ATP-binding protein n=1 Tax=Tropicimonas sp. TH_r6 TaxID=3082085 RepID=UPI0029539C1E|nr:ABC transporter ATP-binding protein [Tropicimonas sp. TH_r6]MDV7141325.1 ABC transporter ATP-binding protein [Tropicimonas sp. TH_r6]